MWDILTGPNMQKKWKMAINLKRKKTINFIYDFRKNGSSGQSPWPTKSPQTTETSQGWTGLN